MRIGQALLIYSLLILSLLACKAEVSVELKNQKKSQLSLVSKSWEFDQASDYTFNSNYAEITGGQIQLKQLNLNFNSSDLSSGNHVNTVINSSDELSIKTKNDDSLNLKNIIPAKSTNLSGYWRMDGTWLDESGNGFHIVPFGGADQTTESMVGLQSASFDGTNDYAVVSDDNKLDFNGGDFAISFWTMRRSNCSSYDNTRSVGKWNTGSTPGSNEWSVNFCGAAGNGNDIRFVYEEGVTSNTHSTGVSYVLNSWYHIAVSRSGSNLAVFVNGKKTNVNIGAATINNVGRDLYFGASEQFIYFSNSLYDEVAIWNTSLTDLEVKNIYNKQAQRYTELSLEWTPEFNNLIGYWKMDGNWLDSSGNGKDGTPVGNSTFSSSSLDYKVGSHGGSFDGAGDYISTVPLNINTNTITLTAWIKPSSMSSMDGIVFCRGCASTSGLNIRSNDLGYHWNNDSATYSWDSNLDLRLDAWQFVAISVSPTKASLYLGVDGDFSMGENVMAHPPVNFTSNFNIGWDNSSRYFDGEIDEVGIWDTTLTKDEIKIIYEKQKVKLSAHYDSSIFNIGVSGAWTNLKPVTTLPFSKGLLGINGSDATSDYSALVGSTGNLNDDDLMSGLTSYWNFNETVLNMASAGADFEDLSVGGNHASESGGVGIGNTGILGNAASFDAIDDQVTMGTGTILDTSSPYTIQAWVYYTGDFQFGGDGDLPGIFQAKTTETSGVSIMLRANGIMMGSHANFGKMTMFDNSFIGQIKNKWAHIIVVYDGISSSASSSYTFYINGRSLALGVWGGSWSTTSNLNQIGSWQGYPNGKFKGKIDEVAIWNRSLTFGEIKQLYRRGKNGIKYQVRSCDDAVCDTEEWIGPDGSASTYFSELHNNSIINGSGSPAGNLQVGSPNFRFSDFVTAPSANQYFQYRVILESGDESDLCNNIACMPELSSISLEPDSRYFGGGAQVLTNTPVTYKKIDKIEINEDSQCSNGYQLSPDGINFYFWNGSTWATASLDTNRNLAGIVSANIKAYSNLFGTGDLYIKSFLDSDTTQTCSIDKITLEGQF